jgi:thiol-disulfide isomerase/thioredoxin
MNKLAALASVLAVLLCSLAAAEPPRDAAAIVKEYQAIKMPEVDRTKISDPAWVQSYIKERDAAVNKQNELALELFKADPNHPEAIKFMSARWNNMVMRSPATALEEMDKFLKDHPDSKQKADILFARATALTRVPPTLGGSQLMDAIDDFIKADSKDERGAQLLSMAAMRARDNDERVAIEKRIINDYPDSRSAKFAKGAIRKAEGVGKPFDLSFTDAISGQPMSIKGLQGKVVVIDFWATWCGPCVAEMPKMKELYAHYKEQGVEFIGVSLDQPDGGLDKLKEFVKAQDIGWPQYYQGNGWESDFSLSWGINSIPAVFIVDASGNLYSTEARGKLETLIPDLIKKRDEKS